MRHFGLALLVSGVLATSGCSTGATSSTLIPSETGIKLTAGTSITLEKLVYWGAYIGVAYLILDPLAPNWNIEEAQLDPQLVHFNLKMKRYYTGGAGEARLVLERRAKALVREGDFASYQVIEYKESLDSSILGSQRVTEGVIRLIPKA